MSGVISLARPISVIFTTLPEFVTMVQLLAALGIHETGREIDTEVDRWMRRQGRRPEAQHLFAGKAAQ